ncbi:hypothetical protein [Shewanella colwelliana]|uniref:hypothetical protein n=1 Tax=Shewanella colwelliana TaxID=23 RepID=UPI0022AF3155|nr:hypothetical protein [Shewanella colwelliana]MCZ4337638.1 hypothetical protein [Shewanella colwelliana]
MQELNSLLINNAATESLEDFIINFNRMVQDSDRMAETINTLHQEVSALQAERIRANSLAEANALQAEMNRELQGQIAHLNELLTIERQAAQRAGELETENGKLTQQYSALQIKHKELERKNKELLGADKPKRLRDQVKRLKEKSTSKDKTIIQLQSKAKQYRAESREQQIKLNNAIQKIRTLQNEQLTPNLPGLYHRGEHHVIFWPEELTCQNAETGQMTTCHGLYYMHQSGAGRLLTFDMQSSELVAHSAPKGGLKLPNDVKEFAKDWLKRVNVTQGGKVSIDDLKQTNLNEAA